MKKDRREYCLWVFINIILFTFYAIPFSQGIVLMETADPDNPASFDELESLINEMTSPEPSASERTDRGNAGCEAFWFHRSHEEGLEIITVDGQKCLRSTIADGRSWEGNNYDRAELLVRDPVGGTLEPGGLIQVTWTGYFEQEIPSVNEIVAVMQLHGQDNASPANGVYIRGRTVTFRDRHGSGFTDVISTSEMVNEPVTFKMTINSRDSDGYLKFEYKKEGEDWNTAMEKDDGRTKNPGGDNYLKIAGLYDYGRNLVDPGSFSRGRSYSLVTMHATIADITDGEVVNIGNSYSISADQKKMNMYRDLLPDKSVNLKIYWLPLGNNTCKVVDIMGRELAIVNGYIPDL